MEVSQEVRDQFYQGRRTPSVRFVVNDAVRVVSGPHAGRTGAVISIEDLVPEAQYLVEVSSPPFGDVAVTQSDLELLA